MDNGFLIIIFLVVSLVLFISLKNTILKGVVFISLLYILVVSLLLGVIGLIGNKNILSLSVTLIFILSGVWMLILGIVHTLFFKRILFGGNSDQYFKELVFTILIGLLGGVFLLLAHHLSAYSIYTGIHLTSLFLFLVPYIFNGCVNRYLKIPVKILRKWYYPVDDHVEDPLDREMESPLVIAFEFKKKCEDKNKTSFRAKAPKEMEFGKLFYYFINDYNDRNPDHKIDYLNEKNKAIGWIFYFKPKMFSKIRYIDPEETNSFNLVKENSVIVCKRIIEN